MVQEALMELIFHAQAHTQPNWMESHCQWLNGMDSESATKSLHSHTHHRIDSLFGKCDSTKRTDIFIFFFFRLSFVAKFYHKCYLFMWEMDNGWMVLYTFLKSKYTSTNTACILHMYLWDEVKCGFWREWKVWYMSNSRVMAAAITRTSSPLFSFFSHFSTSG